jgi:hypothetical protein
MFCLSLFIETKRNERISVAIRISDPESKIIGNIGISNLVAPGDKASNRGWFTFQVMNQEFTRAGEHAIELVVGSEVVHTIPLPVFVVGQV